MKAKSILLTVPLTVSALTFLTLPADAVCWSWKPCADYQGCGYGALTESQAVLPPLPADGSVPPGSTTAPGGAPGATAAPGHRVSGTAEACQEASGDGDRSATTCAGGEAEAKTGSSAGTGRSASGPATCTTSGTRTCSGKSSIASGASTGPRPASGTSAAACAYASPGEGSTASAASTGPGSGTGSPATSSCAQTGTRSGGSAGNRAGHDADDAGYGDHAGDPNRGERTRRPRAPHRRQQIGRDEPLRRRLACVGYRQRVGIVATLKIERLRFGLEAVDTQQLTGAQADANAQA